MFEVMEHLRLMQNIQAEQSRRLDEQSYRLHQLEMKDLQSCRLENQRYLWEGSSATGGAQSGGGFSGLGFEVITPATQKQKEKDSQDPIHPAEPPKNGYSILSNRC